MKAFLKVVLSIVIFVFGFIISKYIQIPSITLKKEVDGIYILSVLTSIIIAYIIYKYFDKNKEDRIREKELIIKRVEEIYQIVNEDYNKFNAKEIRYINAAAFSKRFHLQIYKIEKLLRLAGIEVEDNFNKKLSNTSRKIKRLLTDSPQKSVIDPQTESIDKPLVVHKGVIYVSQNRRNEINNEYDNLKNLVLEYQLKINRA